MALRILHTFDSDAATFQLVEKPLLGSERTINVSDWLRLVPPQLVPAVSLLLGLAEDESSGVRIVPNSVSLPHSLIASLEGSTAERLSLPRVGPFILDLQHAGRLDEPSFQFRVQWR